MPAQPADKTAAGFTFYHGYLSVVYGLVATEGMIQLGTIDKAHEWEFRTPPFLLLFLGVFIIGLHFWFICSTVDEASHKFYRATRGDRWAYAFFFLDAIVATAFAWLVLAMFHAISSGRTSLFSWYLVASVGSVGYDLYSWLLVITAQERGRDENAVTLIKDYGAIVKGWLIQDCCFCAAASLLLLLAAHHLGPGICLDIFFVLASAGILVADVKFLEFN